MTQRRILVTSALPYANGHIHIGHLVEYLQTDIWVRFQRLRGHRCVYVCADDTHGTAIMIRARNEGRSEAEVIADMRDAHIRDFAAFDIEFNNYGSTDSDENREICGKIWQSIRDAGLVKEKDVEQLYDPEAGTFLADRFVCGTCPHCGSEDQPGDNCSKCAKTYTPAELVNPKSTLSGATPEIRSARHLFIELEQLHDFLTEWTQSGSHLQPEVANYLKGHFLGDELRDWDISRPAPYFGFEIPDSPGNYWYVWFDAPIGYIASTKQWCAANGEDFDNWWRNAVTEIHHFIGKDITYFHTLFWPGMLKTAGFNLPEKVHIHGFLKVAGKKMSKSKGTFVMASTYARHLPSGVLRYYYASKLGSGLDDIDLNLEEFVAKFVSQKMTFKIIGNLGLQMAAGLSPFGQKIVQLFQLDEQMPCRAYFRSRSRERTLRIHQLCRSISLRTLAAVVSRLIFRAAVRTGTAYKSVRQKRPGFRIIQLLDILFFDQSRVTNRLPDFAADFPILITVGAAVIVEFNIKRGEVPDVSIAHISDNLCLAAAFVSGTNHDRRAVGVVRTDVDATMPSQPLKSHPDICLKIFDQMPDVNMPVGIGQR